MSVYMQVAKPVLERSLLDLPEYLTVADVKENEFDDTFVFELEDATGDFDDGVFITPVYTIDESIPSYRLTSLDIHDEIDTETDES